MPTIHVTVDQVDHSASKGHAREHSLIMDRPEAKGGQNKGPLGGETLLLGLGGCFMSNLLAAAKARDIEISDAKTEIAAELADTPARYTDIHMKITARCEPSDELEKLVTIAERGCIAVNTLSRAVNLTIKCG
ncbi:MAG: OsmC family protein [Sedimenticola sp.]